MKKLSSTQIKILANVRDHGDTVGSHGYPWGMSQSGGWSQSVSALERHGLITSELGPWTADPDGVGGQSRRVVYDLTPAGIEALEGAFDSSA
jgi:hypothetical protein